MIYRDSRGLEPLVSLKHYYGNITRQLFVGLAILIGVCTPFSGDVPFGLGFGVPSVLILIILAGLTSPRGKFVLAADVAVAVVGVIIGEWLALFTYSQGMYIPFAILEFISAAFLVSLYFSVKTMRASESHMIGHNDPPEGM
jgi:hypothetical protein